MRSSDDHNGIAMHQNLMKSHGFFAHNSGRTEIPQWQVWTPSHKQRRHYNDVIMGAMASQITSLTIVYSTVYSGTYQRKHQSSASLAFVRGIQSVNSPHKRPVMWKIFLFDDVIMVIDINISKISLKKMCLTLKLLICSHPIMTQLWCSFYILDKYFSA